MRRIVECATCGGDVELPSLFQLYEYESYDEYMIHRFCSAVCKEAFQVRAFEEDEAVKA